MLTRVIAWICVAGLTIGLTGEDAVFLLPLFWIAWRAIERTWLATHQQKAERLLSGLEARARDRGDVTYLHCCVYLRVMIKHDLRAFYEIVGQLEGNDAAQMVARLRIEQFAEQLNQPAKQ